MEETGVLKRFFISLLNPHDRSWLVEAKLASVKIESTTAQKTSARTINLDPGYVALEQLVLSTSKPYNHRIHLSQGVFTDLVFIYQNKNYQPLPWTYPDYQEPAKINYFLQLRSRIKS
jgi:hypothetical protein